MKNAVIVVLLLLVVWLSVIVVRLENFRYATFVGFCSEPTETVLVDPTIRYECLKSKQTRTNALWHLFYALIGDF
jgi:hypothetical protein